MNKIGYVQIGKNKLNTTFFENLENQFRNHANVKISVLASARESKADVKKYAEDILKKLGPNYTAKTIGFVIAIKKWRKPVREE